MSDKRLKLSKVVFIRFIKDKVFDNHITESKSKKINGKLTVEWVEKFDIFSILGSKIVKNMILMDD